MDLIYSYLWGTEMNNKELEALDNKFKLIVLDSKSEDFAIDEDENASAEKHEGLRRSSRNKPFRKFEKQVFDDENQVSSIDADENVSAEKQEGLRRSSRIRKFDKQAFYAENQVSSTKDKEKDTKVSKTSFQTLIMNEENENNFDSRPNRWLGSKCEQCGDVFLSDSSMKSHMSIHQMEMRMVARKKNIFRCLECKKNFDQHAKLMLHRYSHHSQSGSFCNICHSRVEQLDSHRKEIHLLDIGFSG
eukprot:GFUD01044117.1.p1 GENE.GFUD01044117.1~~GFUD01044117.1.p1  ORF type:complete len:246 (-),score=61.33 GFUD01044117.1:43-780(-)